LRSGAATSFVTTGLDSDLHAALEELDAGQYADAMQKKIYATSVNSSEAPNCVLSDFRNFSFLVLTFPPFSAHREV